MVYNVYDKFYSNEKFSSVRRASSGGRFACFFAFNVTAFSVLAGDLRRKPTKL